MSSLDVQTSLEAKAQDDFMRTKMTEDNTVNSFQDKLLKLKYRILNSIDEKNSLSESLKSYYGAIADLRAMFASEAQTKFVELLGKDVFQEIPKLSNDHPVYALWANYAPKINVLGGQIVKCQQSLDSNADGYSKDSQALAQTLQDYQAYYLTTSTGPESPQSFVTSNFSQSIPEVESDSLSVTPEGLDLVNTEAQGLITREEAGVSVGLTDENGEPIPQASKIPWKWIAAAGAIYLLL